MEDIQRRKDGGDSSSDSITLSSSTSNWQGTKWGFCWALARCWIVHSAFLRLWQFCEWEEELQVSFKCRSMAVFRFSTQSSRSLTNLSNSWRFVWMYEFNEGNPTSDKVDMLLHLWLSGVELWDAIKITIWYYILAWSVKSYLNTFILQTYELNLLESKDPSWLWQPNLWEVLLNFDISIILRYWYQPKKNNSLFNFVNAMM